MRLIHIAGLGLAVLVVVWMIAGFAEAQYQRAYYPGSVVYSSGCHPIYSAAPMYYAPRPYYAPPMSGQTYRTQPSYAPTYPSRPTTIASVGAYDNYFQPKTINVQPGTTVRWTNRGRHTHTVTADDDRWDSGDFAPGATYTATFQQPGTYYYYCRYHTDDKMVGTIVVGSGGRRSGAGGYNEESAPGATRGGGRTPSSGY